MSTGQSSVADLLVYITADTFGQIPSVLVRHLIDAGPVTLDALVKRANYKVDEVRLGLLILLHHGIVELVYEFPSGPTSTWKPPEVWPQDPSSLDGVQLKYSVNFSAGLSRIRYPRAIDMVYELLGFHVAVVLKVMLQFGYAGLEEVQTYIKGYRDEDNMTVFDGLPDTEPEVRSNWMGQIGRPTVDAAFKVLIDRDYLQRIPTLSEHGQACLENQKKDALSRIMMKQSNSAKAKGRSKSKVAKLTAAEERALNANVEKNMDDIFLTKKNAVAKRGARKKSRLESVAPVIMKTVDPVPGSLNEDLKSGSAGDSSLMNHQTKNMMNSKYRVNFKSITFDLVKLTMEDLICVRFVAHEERVLLRLVVRTLLHETLRLKPPDETVILNEVDRLHVQETPIALHSRDNNFINALEKRILAEESSGRIQEIERSDKDDWSLKIGAVLNTLSAHPDNTVQQQVDSEYTSYGIRWERVKSLLKRRLLVITLRRMVGTSAARVWNGMIQYFPDQYVTDVDVAELCLVSQNVARASLYSLENLGIARAQSTDIVQARQGNLKQATTGGWVYVVDENMGYARGFDILITSVVKLFERREYELRKISTLQNSTNYGEEEDSTGIDSQRKLSVLQEMAEYAEDMLETYILLLDEHLTILNEI